MGEVESLVASRGLVSIFDSVFSQFFSTTMGEVEGPVTKRRFASIFDNFSHQVC